VTERRHILEERLGQHGEIQRMPTRQVSLVDGLWVEVEGLAPGVGMDVLHRHPLR